MNHTYITYMYTSSQHLYHTYMNLFPKALGSGVDLSFLELCALFNNFRKMMGDHLLILRWSLSLMIYHLLIAQFSVTVIWIYVMVVQENIRRRSKNKTSARALEHFTIRQDDWVKKFNLFPQEIMRLGENCSTSGNCSARGGNEKKILKKQKSFTWCFPRSRQDSSCDGKRRKSWWSWSSWVKRLASSPCKSHQRQSGQRHLGSHLYHPGALVEIQIHHGQEQLNLTQCAPRVALLSSSLAMVTCVMGITGGWTFIFQWYDDIFDDVPTGGLVTVVAFSNGTRSSTLDLPSPQLCSSITASSIRKRPECRLGDIGQIKFTKFTNICQIIQAEVVLCAERLAAAKNAK